MSILRRVKRIMKMKRFLILAAATVIFASCNKNYVCECVDPATGEENQMTYRTNQESHAQRLCNDWQTRTQTAIPEKSEYSCKIQ